MAIITPQELEDASVDAQTLEDVVNGAEDLNGTGTTPSRLGGDRKTLAKVIADAETDLANADIAGPAAVQINDRIDPIENLQQAFASLPILMAEYPELVEFDIASDFRRNCFLDNTGNRPTLKTYDEMFESRLDIPTSSGQYIPETSVNLAYVGLNDRNLNGWLDNMDLTLSIVEVADLPAAVATYAASITSRWPVERVIHVVNTSGSGQNFQPLLPTGLSGDHTTSVHVYGVSGQTDVRMGASQSADAVLAQGQRLSVSASGGACNLRINDGGECYVFGLQFEPGLVLSSYQEGFQVLNRLEFRDVSFIKPNGIILAKLNLPVAQVSGGDTVLSMFSDDRNSTIKCSLNWTGSSISIDANDNGVLNVANQGFPSWSPDLSVVVALMYSSDGSVSMSIDGGNLVENSDNVLDISDLSRIFIGGNLPNANAGSGTEFNVSPMNGNFELFAYKGWE